ncbi:MAG: DUF1489 domain-containing protein [Sphingomonas sp.]|uniref:DUF1489 domain-containing protein n=1 Tax=Sphingomonas sp. TaxID=28214 RepID=UPI001AC1CA57|nr:DUF1489 domain-containing protein [Sphingomonas sp.]MBN8808062.1 DUF1489 domain-containing protein [Sphingomonas sp.]
MPLHLTKVAFGVANLDQFVARWKAREGQPPYELGTRYLPKRWQEVAGQGSLFWILKHQLVARSPIVGFGELEGGRVAIRLDPRLVLVEARPKRAHQGWRYLEDADAPRDLGAGSEGVGMLPPDLVGRLAELALI